MIFPQSRKLTHIPLWSATCPKMFRRRSYESISREDENMEGDQLRI